MREPTPAHGNLRGNLRGDLFGGITAGIVALPLALAFGVGSGLGAAYGLYGAIFIGFFAAIFGGTAVQISGPTGPMTVVTAAVVTTMIATFGTIEAALPALVATFMLAGIIQIGMGLTGIGALIKFVPYPVVSGFMSGIGVIIILLQLFPAVGLPSPKTTVDVAMQLRTAFTDMNAAALAVTILTIVIVYQFPKLTKAVPSVLVALLTVTVLTALAGFDVPVIGDIPKGFPAMHLAGIFDLGPELLGPIITAAATLAALGAIDSLLTSVVADNLTKTHHNSKRELIGQGIGNTISGMFAGLPGAGATMRTVVNVNAGGRTRVSGAVHAMVLLGVLLGAGTYAAYIPKPVLAGILITVGIGILDYRGLRHLNKVPRGDAAVMLIVLLVTVFFDLLVAVGIGVAIAFLLFLNRRSQVKTTDGAEQKQRSAFETEQQADERIPPEIEQDVLVQRITGPLFFGFATTFRQHLQQQPEVRFLILRFLRVPFADQTGVYAFDETVRLLKERGTTVLITGLQEQPGELLRRLRIVPLRVPEEHTFATFDETIAFVQQQRLQHVN